MNPIQLNPTEQSYVLQPHRFQGQIYDVETGLHYNRFRYYDADAGRFISHDPIGLYGGDNHFQYAPNPVAWVDPLGLSKFPYSPRIRDRAVQDPGGHNFPFSFDNVILNSTPTTVRGGNQGYAMKGFKNGREYIYNIIVKDGVITHRDMVSTDKWPQRSRSFGWPIDVNDIPDKPNGIGICEKP